VIFPFGYSCAAAGAMRLHTNANAMSMTVRMVLLPVAVNPPSTRP
jgi:hypothetical protein